MTKESSLRKSCFQCGQSGHNSKTCNNGKSGSFKLFGVMIDPNPHQNHNQNDGKEAEEDHHHHHHQSVDGIGESIRKCKSMGSLHAYSSSSSNHEANFMDHGYLSDGLLDQSKRTHDKKKGVPWTEEEHRSFLIGLKRHGKGNWRGISKNCVPSRTPTQVASHAQKYFIRMNSMIEKRRRRSSLFDMPLKESATTSATHVAASVRPPISPVARTYGIQDSHRMPYMVSYPSSNGQWSGAPKCSPTVSSVPVLNYPNQGCVYPLNGHGNGGFTAPALFVSQALQMPLPQSHGSSEPGFVTPVTKKDGLETSIGALSL